MKFTIKETETKTIHTTREVELDFPLYYRIEVNDYYYDYRSCQRDVTKVTLGVITNDVQKGMRADCKDHYVSIWQISKTDDDRNEIESSWKVEHQEYTKVCVITESMVKGKITKEQYDREVSEMTNEMLNINE
jgi:hypothetical protein